MTLGDLEPAGTRALGRLGGLLYLAVAVILVATLPLLDPAAPAGVPLAFAPVCLLVGAVVLVLPWSRWPREALVSQSVVALVLFTVAARLAPTAYPHYLGIYLAVFLYVGLTQRVRVVLGMTLLIVASYALAMLGEHEPVASLNVAVIFLLGLASAVAQSVVVERHRRASRDIDLVLRTTRELGRTRDVPGTLEVLERTAAELLDADLIVTFLAENIGSKTYIATSTTVDLGQVEVTVESGPESEVERLLDGEQVFVRDAAAPERDADDFVARTGCRSLLQIPLTGEYDRLGAIVAIWRTPRRRPDPLAARTAGIIANEAGRVLARQREEARFRQEATTDPLTGVLNRRAFDERLRHLEQDDTVMLIDLDWFKEVNDRQGHAAGDRALRTLAACMQEAARSEDSAARLGGDEMVMVLRHGGRRGGRLVAEQLRDSWARTGPATTLSIGIAVHAPGETPAATLARADAALYEAKRTGRDCFVIHDGRLPAGGA